MTVRKASKSNAQSTKVNTNPAIQAAQQRGAKAGKVIRKNAIVAADKAKHYGLVAAGGVALGATVAYTFGGAMLKALRG